MKKFIITIIGILFIISCQEQKTPEQLFEERASGVVVILNEYYYEMRLPNGGCIYFTGINSDGDLDNFTLDEELIRKTPQVMTGTGFFIDKQGTIMTNRHVAQPQLDKDQAKAAYINLIKNIKSFIGYGLSQMQQQYADLEQLKQQSLLYDPYSGNTYYDMDRINSINDKKTEIEAEFAELYEKYDGINDQIDPSTLNVSAVCKVGIAYNDTYVTSRDDFFGSNACVVTKVSSKEDVDLALMQLKNKKTPSTAYVFDILGVNKEPESMLEQVKNIFSNDKDKKELRINQDLHMIGYNAGLTLGTTKQGIKVQMTTGKLTQLPDGHRLLYSIPTVQGSSGSPVIDAYGNFVGVNFAKLNGSDNFNFGIPVQQVISFYNE